MAFFDGDEATLTLTQFAGDPLHRGLTMASTCLSKVVTVAYLDHLRLNSVSRRDFQDIHHDYPSAPCPSSPTPDCRGLKPGSFLGHQSCHPRLPSNTYAQGELGSLIIIEIRLAKESRRRHVRVIPWC